MIDFKYMKLEKSAKKVLKKLNKIICNNYSYFTSVTGSSFRPFEEWTNPEIHNIGHVHHNGSAFIIRRPAWDTVICFDQFGNWYELDESDRSLEISDAVPYDIRVGMLSEIIEYGDSILEAATDRIKEKTAEKFEKYSIEKKNTPVYVTNAFSLQMLKNKGALISVEPIDSLPEGISNAIGHDDLAKLLGFEGKNRIELKLDVGDVVYVAQVSSGRLPEGCTELPEGTTIDYYKVEIS